MSITYYTYFELHSTVRQFPSSSRTFFLLLLLHWAGSSFLSSDVVAAGGQTSLPTDSKERRKIFFSASSLSLPPPPLFSSPPLPRAFHNGPFALWEPVRFSALTSPPPLFLLLLLIAFSVLFYSRSLCLTKQGWKLWCSLEQNVLFIGWLFFLEQAMNILF